MVIFLAGNFPQLAKEEKEQAMVDFIHENGYDYHRLVTYYYKKTCTPVINIIRREANNENKQERPDQHSVKVNARSRKKRNS